MKSPRKSMEEFESNEPGTFGIVYKGTVEVVDYKGQKQLFRSYNVANKFLPEVQSSLMEPDLEVIQLKPTLREKLNEERINELSQELSQRKRKPVRMAKNSKIKQSAWLLHLKEQHKKYSEEFKSRKLKERKRLKAAKKLETLEDYY